MKRNKMRIRMISICGIFILLATIITPIHADSGSALSAGQTVYVSVYTHIYSGLKGRPFQLGATLSIRNTDIKYAITLVSVKFYDTSGKLLKDYLPEPVRLEELVSARYIIKEGESVGGSGANFLVTWKAEQKVNPPIIEAIMIGTKSGQGISFVSAGQVITQH